MGEVERQENHCNSTVCTIENTVTADKSINATPADKRKMKHPLLDPCVCKQKNCSAKISDLSRIEIHEAFRRLKYNDQKAWIYNHIEQHTPKRQYVSKRKCSKKFSRYYWFPITANVTDPEINVNESEGSTPTESSVTGNPKQRKANPGNKVYVCKKMFLSTLGFTADKVITTSLATTSSTGITLPDKRGKAKPKHAISEEEIMFMHSHIRSFNPQISHYRREHAPNRMYLPPELKICEMYADYLDTCREQNKKSLGYVSYTRQVKSLNISFAQLGDELCEKCEEHKIHMQSIKEQSDSCETDGGESNNCEKVKKNEMRKMKKYLEKAKMCARDNCNHCSRWKKHRTAYMETRAAYAADKNAVGKNEDELYLSSDMQKVILLPRLPGFKLNRFTKRLVVLNQTFAPFNTENSSSKKALGLLWHEGLSGRKDEDVSSAFIKAMEYVSFRDFTTVVLWLDNCAGLNKCWTLYTALVHFVNTTHGPVKIILKYFTVGHTFMSADSFHQKVEQEMKTLKQVCDWNDFLACVQKSGCVYEIKVEDFKLFENGLSQSALSKTTRPRLDTVCVAEFRKESTSLFYKQATKKMKNTRKLFL